MFSFQVSTAIALLFVGGLSRPSSAQAQATKPSGFPMARLHPQVLPRAFESLVDPEESDLFHSGQPFLLRSLFKTDLCWTDDDGQGQGFTLSECGADLARQTFRWDPSTTQLQSVAEPTSCVNGVDGGAHSLRACSELPVYQVEYDASSWTLLLGSSADQSCLDDGGIWSTGPSEQPTTTTTCSASDPNQAFVPQPLDLAILPDVFERHVVFKICTTEQDYCLGSGSGSEASSLEPTLLTMLPTSSSSQDDRFEYVSASSQIRSWQTPTLCVQAAAPGPAWGLLLSPWTLVLCDLSVATQKFAFNELIQCLVLKNQLNLYLQYADLPQNGSVTTGDLMDTTGENMGLQLVEVTDAPPRATLPMPAPGPGPAVPGPAVPGPAVTVPAVPGPAVPGPAVTVPAVPVVPVTATESPCHRATSRSLRH